MRSGRRGDELANPESILELSGRSRCIGSIRIIGRSGVGIIEMLAEFGRRGSSSDTVIGFEIP